jgi:hypothetical protein
MYGSPSVCTEHECHGWTDKFQLFFLYVRTSRWTDKFQLFQFSRSVAYSQVSLSVRTEEPNQKKSYEKKYKQTKQTEIPQIRLRY